jgi:NTP pyrophosphatase (non-canonical NTP hydrolase)
LHIPNADTIPKIKPNFRILIVLTRRLIFGQPIALYHRSERFATIFLALPGPVVGELTRFGSPQPPDESPLRALNEAAIHFLFRPEQREGRNQPAPFPLHPPQSWRSHSWLYSWFTPAQRLQAGILGFSSCGWPTSGPQNEPQHRPLPVSSRVLLHLLYFLYLPNLAKVAPMPKQKRKARTRPSCNRKFTPPQVGGDFQKLVAVMSRLRSPNGCPWDREQSHATLRTYLIEEAYEVLDALDSTDDAKFAEELGDVLLQVLFHAQIAHEEGRFDISAVVREIHDKMIRRHPHVFGNTKANTAAEVLRNWEQIKKAEREGKQLKDGKDVKDIQEGKDRNAPKKRKDASFASPASSASSTSFSASILDGVPHSVPALLEANQLTRKAARIGFDWPDLDGIFDKLTEETNELHAALSAKPSNRSRVEGEVGDILFVAVNLARHLNVDPEIALKKTSTKFSRRFRTMERLAREQNTTLAQIPRPQMESLWDQAKQLELAPTK